VTSTVDKRASAQIIFTSGISAAASAVRMLE
jgi:hypothetical protein